MPHMLEKLTPKGVFFYLEAFMKQEEKYISEAIIKWVRGNGGDCHKVEGLRIGEPDLDGYINSIPFKAEVKTPTGKPTAIQITRIKQYHDTGIYLACIVTSLDEFKSYIRAWELYQKYKPTLEFIHFINSVGLIDTYGIYT